MSATRLARQGAAGRLDATVDLLDHWRPADGFLMERDGGGLVATGTAATAAVLPGPDHARRAAEAAAQLLADVQAGEDALAVAALSFDGAIPARVTVPCRSLLARAGRPVRRVVISDGADEPALSPAAATRPRDLTAVRRSAQPSEADFAAAVATAVARIRDSELRKVVLARTLLIEGLGEVDPRRLIARLRARDPGCYTIAARGARGRLLVGATPELLLRRDGGVVTSMPLAGSATRSIDPAEDHAAAAGLLTSTKERREHALVVEAVIDTLAPHCRELTIDREPRLVSTATIWHLATAVRGVLRPDPPGALALAAELHPTPAVCGTPRTAALRLIDELETEPRGLYAGMVGWVDGRGDGEWAVTLRCAVLGDGWARLYAGAGIVEGSDPSAEVAETEAKFRTLLDALGM
jgi:isochorismate synthase